jgi:hypothetical protein
MEISIKKKMKQEVMRANQEVGKGEDSFSLGGEERSRSPSWDDIWVFALNDRIFSYVKMWGMSVQTQGTAGAKALKKEWKNDLVILEEKKE